MRNADAVSPIMNGAFTRQSLIAPGDRVRAEFEGRGSVEATFA